MSQPPVTGEPAASRGPRRWRVLGFAGGAALALVAVLVISLVHRAGGDSASAARPVPLNWQRTALSRTGLADRLGVQISQVAVTGQGGLVDLRYRVIDPDLASAIHDPATPPAVIDDRTGVVVSDLFMGHQHSEEFRAGTTYYLIFTNPGNLVRRGTTVSVLLGDSQVDHVRVR
jgi:hypothetical protein